jgi:ATP phosphoribosyltransferase regulatory subunit
VQKAADYLLGVWEKCKGIGLRSNLLIDIGMTGEVNYYTGLIFRAYAKGASSSVISGGRYDNLLGELGLDCPAAGFAVDVDNMIKATGQKGIWKPKEYKVLIVYSDNGFLEALKYSEDCRMAGSTANLMNFRDLSKPEQYKEQYGYDEIIYFR